VPTGISYIKGIDKILEKRRVFQFRMHFSLSSAKEIQGKREMVKSVDDCKCHG